MCTLMYVMCIYIDVSCKNIIYEIYMVCQGHKEPQEQRLKRKFKSNFQTRNKTKLCDSKTRTQDLRT
jgi:hypothetical protein